MARGSLLDHLGEIEDVLGRGRIGLLLDLDGTISEIVREPHEASVSPHVKSTLTELRLKLALTAILTGRSARQARDIVGLQDLVYMGNHGLERLERESLTLAEEAGPFAPFLEQLMLRLRERFPSAGLIFEDKGGSFAVHYRTTGDPEIAREGVLGAIQELAGEQVKVLMGKTVINVLPPVNMTKGTAVASLAAEYDLAGVIVIGDDVTDIDAFRSASCLSERKGFWSVSVAVVGPDSPLGLEGEADYTLSSVSQVEEFLTWLVEQTR